MLTATASTSRSQNRDPKAGFFASLCGAADVIWALVVWILSASKKRVIWLGSIDVSPDQVVILCWTASRETRSFATGKGQLWSCIRPTLHLGSCSNCPLGILAMPCHFSVILLRLANVQFFGEKADVHACACYLRNARTADHVPRIST